MPEVHETEIDGVRCFWIDSGRPTLSSSLIFRAGLVDESFHTHGWHHLLEHCALHGRESGALGVNGSVSLTSTSFDAHGPVEQVTEHLTRLTTWLADPDLDEISRETGVLRAEQRTRGRGVLVEALMWRYGAEGPGLMAADEYGLTRADAPSLMALAAEAYTQENAVLALDGPPPPGLRLFLPADGGNGPRAIPRAVPCETAFPGQYITGGLVVSGTVTRSVAATLVPALIEARIRARFRDLAGAAYAPWSTYEPVDKQNAVILAGSDVSDAITGECAVAAQGIVEAIAESGADPGDLHDLVARIGQAMRDPYNTASFAWRAAHRALVGEDQQTPEQVISEIESVVAADLREPAAELARTALIGAPTKAVLARSYKRIERPRWPPPVGRRYRSHNWPADRSVMIVSETHIAAGGRTESIGVAFDDVVGMIRHPDGVREIVARDSWNFTMDPSVWTHGTDVATYLDRHVPPELHLAPLEQAPTTPGERMPWLRRWYLGFRLVGPRTRPATRSVMAGPFGLFMLLGGIATHAYLAAIVGAFWVAGAVRGAWNATPPPGTPEREEFRDNIDIRPPI